MYSTHKYKTDAQVLTDIPAFYIVALTVLAGPGFRCTVVFNAEKSFQVNLAFGRMPYSVTMMQLMMDWHLTACGFEHYKHCSLLLSPTVSQFHGL